MNMRCLSICVFNFYSFLFFLFIFVLFLVLPDGVDWSPPLASQTIFETLLCGICLPLSNGFTMWRVGKGLTKAFWRGGGRQPGQLFALLVFGMNYARHFWDEDHLDVWVLGCDVFGSDSSYTFHANPIFLRLSIFTVHGRLSILFSELSWCHSFKNTFLSHHDDS